MKKLIEVFIVIGFVIVSHSANAGQYHECACGYDGISGDWALFLQVKNFENEMVHKRKIGLYFSQRQCNQVASTAATCAYRSEDSYRYCQCTYDAISGDYLLTSYLYDLDEKLVYAKKVALFFGASQCSNAALNYRICR